MRRRVPARRVVSRGAVRAAIRVSDWARSTGIRVLLLSVALIVAAVWATSSSSAHVRVFKSWERLFGSSARMQAYGNQVGVRPEASGISGYTVTSFDAHDAGTAAANGTIGVSIDAAGDTAGTYIDGQFVGHGFFRAANGAIAEFSASDAGASPMQGTFAIGMDPTGSYIAGMYADSGNAYHGFVRTVSGTITEFDAGEYDFHQGTIASSVNSSGTVTGVFTNPGGPYRGYVRAPNGKVTLFDASDAGKGDSPQGTLPIGINNSGMVTGLYIGSNGVSQGFIRAANGGITEFQVPCQGTTCYATAPISIDAAGDIAGAYGTAGVYGPYGQATTKLGHGFIRSASGTITTFDPPGSTIGSTLVGGLIGGTLPLSIDPNGNYVTGFYSDVNNIEHGFLLTSSGTTSFDAPNVATSGVLPLTGTGAGGVNASGAIVGAYVGSGGVFHGLLLTPKPLPACAKPTFSPPAGTYATVQTVSISDTTPGASIYYTTDGKTKPTPSSAKYSAGLTVSSAETIQAIAVASGCTASPVASAAYTLQAAPPSFSPAVGTYTAVQTVILADTTPGAAIYYTADGKTAPTANSMKYTKAGIKVGQTTTIEAVAIATGYANSIVAIGTYVIHLPQTILFAQPTSPVIYGVKPMTLTASASSGLPVTLSLVSGPATLKGNTLTITGAGSVVVAANQPGNATYSAAAQVTRTITVNKAGLTVKANNLSMKAGGAVPALTYGMSGFVNGDTQAKATTGAPKLTTTATSKSVAGSYPITVAAGTLAAGNYGFSYVNGTLTVTK